MRKAFGRLPLGDGLYRTGDWCELEEAEALIDVEHAVGFREGVMEERKKRAAIVLKLAGKLENYASKNNCKCLICRGKTAEVQELIDLLQGVA